MPFLKEEKSEHERARTPMLAVQPCCARHCELPLSKMGNKGLFPGVAVPLAFFCTLFFRHRKKSVSAPWDGQSQSAPESARQSPPRGFAYGKVVAYRCKQGAFRSPPAPLRIASEVNEYPMKVISPSLTPESARHSPSKGNFLGRGFSLRSKQGAFRSPPAPPSGSRRTDEAWICACGHAGRFPRGKQSSCPVPHHIPPVPRTHYPHPPHILLLPGTGKL